MGTTLFCEYFNNGALPLFFYLMRKPKLTKFLSITIESSDKDLMVANLRKIETQIRSGRINYDRGVSGSTAYEWYLSTTIEGDYKEELINDQWCQVYQSRLNYE